VEAILSIPTRRFIIHYDLFQQLPKLFLVVIVIVLEKVSDGDSIVLQLSSDDLGAAYTDGALDVIVVILQYRTSVDDAECRW